MARIDEEHVAWPERRKNVEILVLNLALTKTNAGERTKLRVRVRLDACDLDRLAFGGVPPGRERAVIGGHARSDLDVAPGLAVTNHHVEHQPIGAGIAGAVGHDRAVRRNLFQFAAVLRDQRRQASLHPRAIVNDSAHGAGPAPSVSMRFEIAHQRQRRVIVLRPRDVQADRLKRTLENDGAALIDAPEKPSHAGGKRAAQGIPQISRHHLLRTRTRRRGRDESESRRCGPRSPSGDAAVAPDRGADRGSGSRPLR